MTRHSRYFFGIFLALVLSALGYFIYGTCDPAYDLLSTTSISGFDRMEAELWKGPFETEGLIYVSTETFNSTNPTEFFEKAQLLWHINPQTTHDDYQKINRHVSIPASEEFKKTGLVYAHVLEQETAKIGKHPEIPDPKIRYYSDVLMKYPLNGGSEILGPPRAWYDVRLVHIPCSCEKCNTTEELHRLDKPPAPIQRQEPEETVIAREIGSVANSGKEVLNVEFEIGGGATASSTGHESPATMKIGIGKSVDIKTMVKNITLIDTEDPTRTLTRIYKPTVERSKYKTRRQMNRELLLGMVCGIAHMVLYVVMTRTWIGLWKRPRPETAGISRATMILWTAEWMPAYILDTMFSSSMVRVVNATIEWYVRWLMIHNLKLPPGPWNAIRMVREDISDTARDRVDKRVVVWIKWSLNSLAVLCIGCLVFKYNWTWFVILCGKVSMSLHWVPQLWINHASKVGDNTPVKLHVVCGVMEVLKVCGKQPGPLDLLLYVISGMVHLGLVVQYHKYQVKV